MVISSPVQHCDHGEPGCQRGEAGGAEEDRGRSCRKLLGCAAGLCCLENGEPGHHDGQGRRPGGGETVGGGERLLPLTFNGRFLVQEMLKEAVACEPAAMDSEDVLFLLYTSGSTGKPKGLVHTQAGYLLYAALTHRVKVTPEASFHTRCSMFSDSMSSCPQYVFSYQDGDVFGCVADIGWITGHSYTVYGPLANGGTTVLFESTPVYPNPGMTSWSVTEHKNPFLSLFQGMTASGLLECVSSTPLSLASPLPGARFPCGCLCSQTEHQR